MTITDELLKKIFNKKELDAFRKDYNVNAIRDYAQKCVKSEGGKYCEFVKNFSYQEKQLKQLEKLYDKEYKNFCAKWNRPLGNYSICLPDRFSDSIVKPKMREFLKDFKNYDLHQEYIAEASKIHFIERAIQQLKSALSEFILLIQCADNIIPTTKNRLNTDFYLINNNELEDLDVKTSKWPSFFYDKIKPKDALKLLYEDQGVDRFSSNSRLLIVAPHVKQKANCNLSFQEQLNITYTFEWDYKKKKELNGHYKTSARILFL
jgi:hypothetical protein